MEDKIVFVVRRRFWISADDSVQQWLAGPGDEVGEGAWSDKREEAFLYFGPDMAFVDGLAYGGFIFIRLPSGKELYVEEKDFLSPEVVPARAGISSPGDNRDG